jgi:hypothetical protein
MMYEVILQKAASDPGLAKLIHAVEEYADIYALSKDRQKGCDGMGEAATLKEEFRNALENLIQYCVEHDYLPVNTKADYDILARKIVKRDHERIA